MTTSPGSFCQTEVVTGYPFLAQKVRCFLVPKQRPLLYVARVPHLVQLKVAKINIMLYILDDIEDVMS